MASFGLLLLTTLQLLMQSQSAEGEMHKKTFFCFKKLPNSIIIPLKKRAIHHHPTRSNIKFGHCHFLPPQKIKPRFVSLRWLEKFKNIHPNGEVFMVIFVPWDRIRKTKSPTKQIKTHQKTNIQVTWIPTPLVTPKCSFMVSSLAIWAKSRSHFDFLESSWYEDPTPFQDPLPAPASMGPMVYLPYMNG